MARVAPTTSVQAGLADRMKKKEPQTATAGANTGASKPNYSSRFQNPGAGSNMSRTAPGGFQNQGTGGPAPAQRARGTMPRFCAGQTSGRPGG